MAQGEAVFGGPIWRRKMRTLAKRMDVDGDGFVMEQDFIMMADRYEKLSKSNPAGQPEKFRERFRQVWINYYKDAAKDGALTPDRFADGLFHGGEKRLREDDVPNNLEMLFDIIDTNHDGFIEQGVRCVL